MKKERSNTLFFSLQILLCLFLNWGGDQIVSRLNWPVWLDSIGTVLCAYHFGPFCGAVVGASSNILGHILYGVSLYYSLISILIAVIVGFAAGKDKLETLLGVLNVSAILAVSVAITAYPINLLINGVSTGNNWGDAVTGFLRDLGIPTWAGLLVGQLYVELLDKLIILLAFYIFTKLFRQIIRLIRSCRFFHPNHGSDSNLIVLLVMGAWMLSLAAGRVYPVWADETDSLTEINYSDYVQTIYSTSNGLPCGESNDIAMTGDGIMWVGTYAGLYRNNGQEFRWIDSFDSVRNVNCLYVDEEGRLWIGTNDKGLSIMINEEVVNVIDESQGLPSNSVKSIIRSSDGYYYVGTSGSMQILTLNCGLKRIRTLSEVSYADHLAADQNGNVASVNNAGTLFLMRQGRILVSGKLPKNGPVYKSCAFDPDGTLLVATTENEIYRFDISQDTFKELEVIRCPGLRTIKTLYFLENGELFICADNGIAHINRKNVYEKINTNEFNNSIDHMMKDYQGNLWFTSSRLGLLRMAPSDFRDIYRTAGMENRVVNTIVQWNGVYYIGTDKGMDSVDLKGKKALTDAVTERFSGLRIRCMIVDTQNHLWVCTYGSGLVELEPDGTEHLYNSENGAFGNRARVVKELKDGTILAAGDSGLSFIRDHVVENTINRSEERISSMVLTVTELGDGRILAGTDGDGIAVIKDRKVVRMLTIKDGLGSDVILRTVPDTVTGGVFVVTSNGLCYMNSDEAIRQLYFPYYNNYDIWIKGTDTLFVLSSAGIYTVDRKELLSAKDELTYDLLNSRRGLNGSLTANAWTWYSEESDELFLPCDTGVFAVNTNSFFSSSNVYRMAVTGIWMDGRFHRIRNNASEKIPRGTGRIEIVPEVINYTVQDPYVGYMLEGFDKDWTIVPQNSLGSITYTNLPTGDFVFHLAVFDNNQEYILAQRTYRFTKEMEMYDNSWFILYILILPMFTVCWLSFLLFKRHEAKIQAQLDQANRQIEMGKQTVIAIARTVDAKDERTSEHSKRVALYSKQIAERFGLDEKQCQDIEWAAQMHDIGKIAIPDAILNKASRLTDEEYATMKSHTTRGAEILKDFTLLDHVIEGAEFHHERYDGKGYPKGLKGEDIPLYARIIGVADAFDAMTANRIYRKQMDFGYVLNELEKGRGTQFDPHFVDILLQLIHEGTIDLNKIYHVSAEDIAAAEKKDQDHADAVDPKKPEQGGNT
ncbi:MAG: HD domain-containing protein [Blautia sp.]|nr:HD domain-containing protein [Blautia sp.]